jgi:hypothetical protein
MIKMQMEQEFGAGEQFRSTVCVLARELFPNWEITNSVFCLNFVLNQLHFGLCSPKKPAAVPCFSQFVRYNSRARVFICLAGPSVSP